MSSGRPSNPLPRDARFDWKGTSLTVPLDTRLADAWPDERDRDLVVSLICCATKLGSEEPPRDGRPRFRTTKAAVTQPFCVSYRGAGVDDESGFQKLQRVQARCLETKLFDLTSLVVLERTPKRRGEYPGKGYYSPHVRDASEWGKYVSLAAAAVKRARTPDADDGRSSET